MTSKSDNTLPTVKSSRARSMENATEIYSCECGHRYLSFSALYLHAKNQHDVRISTKKSQKNHQITRDGCKIIKTYFYKEPPVLIPNTPQNSINKAKSTSEQFKEILQQYRQSIRLTYPSSQVRQDHTLHLLEEYINEISTQLDADNSLPKDIAYFFNEFLAYYLPARRLAMNGGTNSAKQHGEDLMMFWEWLKMKKMSQVQLAWNEQYFGVCASLNG